ncbi:thiamine-phosphate synthase [Candidatus Methanoplasma termitum]|uniref:Thiamine-phosphate synthase n=1 Tax=Candidatus Methanoplasma termitum TaxID=1577791 RepID=A0A0A7LAW0_9ARCH|nr:thiamine phosphate synthase [Candidatus Methanoplasma termitum]AIZ56209.1 thiamine-phosphate synthase [Candidatus Methanoplasma termitum]
MFELCVITDRTLSNGLSEAEVARLAYAGGADIVQLRMKNSDGKEMLEQAIKIKAIADEYAKFFIVNDRVDIALLSDADGVHLGQSDIPIEYARELLGDDKIIGISAHNVKEAKEAESKGADYIGVGSVFTTSTKKDAHQGQGLDIVFKIKQAVDIPIIAIGGINRGNIQDVIRAGADGVAVISAVVAQKDVSAAAHELRDMILKVRPNI